MLDLRAIAVHRIRRLDTIYKNSPSLRRLVQDLSHPLITMLQQECSRATCPEMKAGEWMYLCVAHGNDGAMEASLVISHEPNFFFASLTDTAAMLRHRLHFAHRGRRDGAPQLAASVPITVRKPREHLPTPSFSAPPSDPPAQD